MISSQPISSSATSTPNSSQTGIWVCGRGNPARMRSSRSLVSEEMFRAGRFDEIQCNWLGIPDSVSAAVPVDEKLDVGDSQAVARARPSTAATAVSTGYRHARSECCAWGTRHSHALDDADFVVFDPVRPDPDPTGFVGGWSRLLSWRVARRLSSGRRVAPRPKTPPEFPRRLDLSQPASALIMGEIAVPFATYTSWCSATRSRVSTRVASALALRPLRCR